MLSAKKSYICRLPEATLADSREQHAQTPEGKKWKEKDEISPLWPAERFLFVVGATYIYNGSNNKRESPTKSTKSTKTDKPWIPIIVTSLRPASWRGRAFVSVILFLPPYIWGRNEGTENAQRANVNCLQSPIENIKVSGCKELRFQGTKGIGNGVKNLKENGW